MIHFNSFLTEARGTIAGSGSQMDRHERAYITPHLGSETPTHILAKSHNDIPVGTNLRLHRVELINGKNHVHASDESGNKHVIPVTKLHKPGEEPPNEGHKYEFDFIDRLKHHRIMPKEAKGAGSSSGTDFVAENKKKKITHRGVVSGEMLPGETKKGTTAAFGQIAVHHNDEKGWHIPDTARANRPRYASAIEKAGVIDHMNEHMGHPSTHVYTKSGLAQTKTIKHPDLSPAHAYLKDHHVKVLQVGGYGTYRVGDVDETGHGLPEATGTGKFIIRQKKTGNNNIRTIAFHPDGVKGLNKSHIDLDKDPHIEDFKKTLGHTPEKKETTKNSGGLHMFDVDDTLFHTTAKIHVKDKHGNTTKSLSNSEFNTHTLPDGHTYDFSEFRDADKFHKESKPISKMIDKIKSVHGNVKEKPDSKVILNTARANFDDKNRFLDKFKKHGIDIDNIHVERAGNIPGNEHPSEKKAQIVRNHLSRKKYKDVHLYDDSLSNLKALKKMKSEYPDVNFHAHHVQPNGTTKKLKD